MARRTLFLQHLRMCEQADSPGLGFSCTCPAWEKPVQATKQLHSWPEQPEPEQPRGEVTLMQMEEDEREIQRNARRQRATRGPAGYQYLLEA